MRDKTLALQAEHPIAGGDPIDFPVEAHALFHSRLLLGGCGYNHGSQCTRHHGQGRTEEADREHEISGVHGTVASLEEHRGDAGVRGREREERPADTRARQEEQSLGRERQVHNHVIGAGVRRKTTTAAEERGGSACIQTEEEKRREPVVHPRRTESHCQTETKKMMQEEQEQEEEEDEPVDVESAMRAGGGSRIRSIVAHRCHRSSLTIDRDFLKIRGERGTRAISISHARRDFVSYSGATAESTRPGLFSFLYRNHLVIARPACGF